MRRKRLRRDEEKEDRRGEAMGEEEEDVEVW